MQSEDVSLGRQVKRHKDVIASLIQLWPHLHTSDLMEKEDQDQHAFMVKTILGRLKGPLMKAAQLFGNIPDMLPEPYAESCRSLQSHAPSMGWPFVKRRMVGELGAHWESFFSSFEKKAANAASLGQVHRAQLREGPQVAVKLQYPDMKSTLKADLAYLKIGMKLFETFGGAFDLTEIFSEVEEALIKELDYHQEAIWCSRFGDALSNMEGVFVPEVYPSLSTEKLLVLSWVEGASLLSFKEASVCTKNTLARHLFRGWYTPFYQKGWLHGDPHMGNFLGHVDGSITLLDFGCVRQFSYEFVEGVVALYKGLLHNDVGLMTHAYEVWGFTHLTHELIGILNKWALFLYGPVLHDKKGSLNELVSSRQGQVIAKEVYSLLKRQGKIAPPRSFVFMDRVAVGLGSVFMHLDARLNWHRLFEELIEKRPRHVSSYETGSSGSS